VHYEAMAAGLPIITTNRGGNAEVVKGFGNGAIIDDYTNPDEFAKQILKFAENTEESILIGQKGRAMAEERFGWNRVAGEVLSLINEVPNKKTYVKKKVVSKKVAITLNPNKSSDLKTTTKTPYIADIADNIILEKNISSRADLEKNITPAVVNNEIKKIEQHESENKEDSKKSVGVVEIIKLDTKSNKNTRIKRVNKSYLPPSVAYYMENSREYFD